MSWKPIKGFEGLYEISNTGVIKSLARVNKNGRHLKEKIWTIAPKYSGYVTCGLRRDGVRHSRYIHRLVAEAFVPNPGNKPDVNHKDGNRQNNHASNLEWCTSSENSVHAYDVGLNPKRLVIEFHGRSQALQDWCRELGISYVMAWKRLNKGLSVEEAFLSAPKRKFGFSRKRLSYGGKTMSVREWAEEKGIPYATLAHRIRIGWSVRDALETPVRSRGKSPKNGDDRDASA